MAQEYLSRVARQTAAPASFNMQTLIRQLPQSSSASNLSQQWGKEFLKSRPMVPVENFSAQWTQQYIANSPSLSMQKAGSSSMTELESAWTTAVGTSQGQASVLFDFEEEFFYGLVYKSRPGERATPIGLLWRWTSSMKFFQAPNDVVGRVLGQVRHRLSG